MIKKIFFLASLVLISNFFCSQTELPINSSENKFIILCHGAFNYVKNKTGNMLIRYRSDEVVGIIDNTKVGETAQTELGYGGDIPVVENFDACESKKPDTLVIENLCFSL